MAVDCLLALATAGGLGAAALLLGFRSWLRSSVVSQLFYSTAIYVSAGCLGYVLIQLGDPRLVGGLVGGLGSEVGRLHAATGLHAEWRYSMLLACFLPSALFGLLLLTKPSAATLRGLSSLAFLLGVGVIFILTNLLLWWLITFELLLLVSLYLLRLTSKSERIGDAVAEMFFWTLAGSICLLFGSVRLATAGLWSLDAIYLEGGVSSIVGLLLIVGFGVKVPLWPCFSWLLKAHVEASVEFSILLSGVVVKFGALGLYRALLLQANPLGSHVVLACGTLAIIESTFRLVGQRDLKRVVALTTVIEMNWIGVCLGLGGGLFDQIGAFLLVAHSLTTAGEFFSVECVYRRLGTRDSAVASGLAYSAPFLFGCLFLTTLVTIGFPASSLFAAKLFFLTGVAQFSLGLCVFYAFWFVLVLPVVFLRIWLPVWFGQPQPGYRVYDLTGREAAVLLCVLGGGVLFGVYPTLALGGA